jgi:hypothetical protein
MRAQSQPQEVIMSGASQNPDPIVEIMRSVCSRLTDDDGLPGLFDYAIDGAGCPVDGGDAAVSVRQLGADSASASFRDGDLVYEVTVTRRDSPAGGGTP